MKKSEFVKEWCDRIDAGRLKNYPDMRLSERVMSSLDDKKSAEKHWRKHRYELSKTSLEEWRRSNGFDK